MYIGLIVNVLGKNSKNSFFEWANYVLPLLYKGRGKQRVGSEISTVFGSSLMNDT